MIDQQGYKYEVKLNLINLIFINLFTILKDVKVQIQASDNMDIEEEDEHIHKKSKKDSEEENNLDERDFTAELEEKDRRISMLQTTLQVWSNFVETLFNDSWFILL